MKRPYFWFVCAFATLCAGASVGQAQPPAPGGPRPPAFSPYLNLARPNSPPVLNYYGLVRPELQFRQAINNLQQEVTLNQQAIGNITTGDPTLPVTGHVTQYMNHGGFFMNNFSGALPALGSYGSGTAIGSGVPATGGVGSAPRRR